jgi:EAL domain-containing protein (putative c-di-GMP-specific phosphodiesterase class I)
MLLIASETIRANPSLNDVVREMSFTLSFFASADTFAELMAGQSRRIVILTESDISKEMLHTLKAAKERMSFAVLVAADRASLRSSKQAELVDKLASFDNLEWVGKGFNFDGLSASARRCRRRMLKVSRLEVEEALDRGEFVLRYQPKVERNSGSEWLTREAEALVRWHHPVHGLMGPLEFLPETEAFGLMGKLSDYVLKETAQQLSTWKNSGIHLNACINLASSQLGDPMLAERYAEIVKDTGLECGSFTFEVIEQDLADPDAPHIQMIRSLRKQGIKIHASALRRAQKDTVSLTVLAAVTGLAHNLGISVCAEGVEDQVTFEFLKTIECDKMQGFLISEAVIPSIIRRVYSAKEASDEEVA